MRILVLHNHYQHAGGEDVAVRSEADLLAARGHDVTLHTVSNGALRTGRAQAWAALGAAYSAASRREVAAAIDRVRPHVVHVHNFFPLLTPSVYDACRAARIPVVQTLHNYRLLCVNAELFRDGRPCEACVGRRLAWPGILHACYRRSRGASAAVAVMQTTHRLRRTWTDRVDVYIALTEFARSRFIRGGLPRAKIVIKPNFVGHDPGAGTGAGRYALFVGRLAAGKGVDTLFAAWQRLQGAIPLKIVGDGPLAASVRAASRAAAGVEWLGARDHESVLSLMKDAWMLLLPSLYYENLPMVVPEAFAAGLPVIASDVGSVGGLIEHGQTGLRVPPGDAAALAAAARWLWRRPGDRMRMGRSARLAFEQTYTAERNYRALMAIYARVMKSSAGATALPSYSAARVSP
jgi:glycosyltransferase involved in cell wall biosynthesis